MNENQPVIPNSKSLPLHTRTAHIRRIPLLNHTKPPSGKRKNHCQFIVTKASHIHRVLKLDRQNQKSLTSDNSSFHRSPKNALQYIQLDIKHFPSVGRAALVNVSLLSPNLRPFFCPYIFFWEVVTWVLNKNNYPTNLGDSSGVRSTFHIWSGKYGLSYLRNIWASRQLQKITDDG